MPNMGKCPKCEKLLTSVQVEDVAIDVNMKHEWKGFSYHCPSCRSVISVQMNPLTLNEDLKNEMVSSRQK
jgi:hypothetical protein